MNLFKKTKPYIIIAGLVYLMFTSEYRAQEYSTATVTIDLENLGSLINKNIYGQFSEHLGSCIYGGIWVGEDSPIPNTRGIRNDVLEALKKLEVPVLRWPGGCFADEYHWMDGIGPRQKRPKMVNTNWGGVVEDNSFGTHEFLDLCELIGAEPYINGNVGSGTVEEFVKWVEYTTSDGENPMADLRRQNGREEPWEIKYWGIGNENWGCGGRMRPEYYADLYRRFSTFVKNYGDNKVFRIASGPNIDDTVWTDVVMNISGSYMDGLSLHYYTSNSSPAAKFEEKGWFDVINRTLRMDEIISGHSRVMDTYDPDKRVALIVDEWGTWHEVEPGTNPSFLYQQNTMRDAVVAASNLNIFHKHSDRVRMTNIAQMVNVLQSMILTKEDKMLLTPTYHVFEMYKVHQNSINLPIELNSPDYVFSGNTIPAVNGSASINTNGLVHISLCNVNPHEVVRVAVELKNYETHDAAARILTSDEMNSLNSFDNPNSVSPDEFSDYEFSKNTIEVNMPAKSVIVLELTGKVNSKIGAAVEVENPVPQLKYNYYEGILFELPDFKTINPIRQGLIDRFSIPENNSESDYSVTYSGYIRIPENGFYNFYSNSDDGSKLYIDGKLLINNDGRHAPIETTGFVNLNKGFHKIEAEFFQAGGGAVFEISIEGGNLKKQIIPAEMLYHSAD